VSALRAIVLIFYNLIRPKGDRITTHDGFKLMKQKTWQTWQLFTRVGGGQKQDNAFGAREEIPWALRNGLSRFVKKIKDGGGRWNDKKEQRKSTGVCASVSKVFTEGCLPYGITSVTSSTTLRSDARRIKVVLHIKKRMIRYLANIKKTKGTRHPR
jgi:hypothetical protein